MPNCKADANRGGGPLCPLVGRQNTRKPKAFAGFWRAGLLPPAIGALPPCNAPLPAGNPSGGAASTLFVSLGKIHLHPVQSDKELRRQVCAGGVVCPRWYVSTARQSPGIVKQHTDLPEPPALPGFAFRFRRANWQTLNQPAQGLTTASELDDHASLLPFRP